MDLLTEKRRKELAGLSQTKARKELGEYLIEGRRLLEAAVLGGVRLLEVLVTHEAASDPEAASLMQGIRVPVRVVPSRDLDRITDVRTHQGWVGVAALPAEEDAQYAGMGRVLALDGVQDPGNVGTLIRTAAWFGFEAVVLGRGCADPYAPKVVRASMGGLWDLRVDRTRDLAALLGQMTDHGVEAWAADTGGVDRASWTIPERLVLVLGSEAHGISEPVRRHCAGTVSIPAAHGALTTESLNVSMAGSILMAESVRPGKA